MIGLNHTYNRKQFVSLGSFKSDMLHVSCGVPQGSVLGPILFLLYVNDFQKSSNILDFHLFADMILTFFSLIKIFQDWS